MSSFSHSAFDDRLTLFVNRVFEEHAPQTEPNERISVWCVVMMLFASSFDPMNDVFSCFPSEIGSHGFPENYQETVADLCEKLVNSYSFKMSYLGSIANVETCNIGLVRELWNILKNVPLEHKPDIAGAVLYDVITDSYADKNGIFPTPIDVCVGVNKFLGIPGNVQGNVASKTITIADPCVGSGRMFHAQWGNPNVRFVSADNDWRASIACVANLYFYRWMLNPEMRQDRIRQEALFAMAVGIGLKMKMGGDFIQ